MSARLSPSQADAILDEMWRLGGRDEIDLAQTRIMPRFAFDMAVAVVDGTLGGTSLAAMVEKWRAEDEQRTHAGGRPGRVPLRAALIIQLMHAIAGESMSVRRMADTIAASLTSDDFVILGLREDTADGVDWYQRLDSALTTLRRLVDPYAYPRYPRADPERPAVEDRITRQRRLSSEKRKALAAHLVEHQEWNEIRQERLDDLMFELNANVIRSARPLLASFRGDIALDATYTRVNGRQSGNDLSLKARSILLEAGLWGRGGDHSVDESNVKRRSSKFKFGFETDIVTITGGKEDNVPELILAANLHRPGAISRVAERVFRRIAALELPSGNISVDRAYNNLDPANFHQVMLRHGYEFIFDYPEDELGSQENYYANGTGFIMVEGTWYLALMPDDLVDCVKNSRLDPDEDGYIDAETLTGQLESRQSYQLTRHGRRDADGFQRYLLPNPDNYIAFDHYTGELAEKPTMKTVTIPMSVGMRWAQKYPYLSEEWHTAYNFRSTVERKNAQLKRGTTTDLDNADKRPARSYAANAISVAMLITAHNIRTIDNFLRKAEGIDTSKSHRRRSRRRPEELLVTDIAKQRDGRSRRKAA